MAGHSKWANIRHRKAAQDAKRGKIFTKIIRELVVAAKEGGADMNDNPKLRQVVDKALGANMKRDTIDKAIARGAGAGDGESYAEKTYEGYGVGGVAVLVKCLTDNVNRTVSEVRAAFSKNGGNLGTDGSVSYLFSHQGQIVFTGAADENALLEAALEAGAEDMLATEEGGFIVQTAFVDYLSVKETLCEAGFDGAGELVMVPATKVELDREAAIKIWHLIDVLEDLDDVQEVFTNAHVSDDVLAQFGED